MGRLGRRKTLRGGEIVTSLRKKVLVAPSDYKQIVRNYIKAPKFLQGVKLFRKPGKPATPSAAAGATTYKAFNLSKPDEGFEPVKAAWQKVVDAKAKLIDVEKTASASVNGLVKGNNPQQKAAYVGGATSSALAKFGVTVAPPVIGLLYVAGAGCAVGFGTVTAAVAVAEISLCVVTLGLWGYVHGLLTNLFATITKLCIYPAYKLEKGYNKLKDRTGGGDPTPQELEEAKKKSDEISESGAKDTNLKDAITKAAASVVEQQKAYNAALLEGIAALQVRYGNADSGKEILAEIEELPNLTRPGRESATAAAATDASMLAISMVAQAQAQKETGNEAEMKAEEETGENKKVVEERGAMVDQLINENKNRKGRLNRGPRTASQASASEPEPEETSEGTTEPAPEPEAAAPEPEAAAPEPEAVPTPCWTQETDGKETWYEQEGQDSVWDLPDGAKVCGQGGRRRRRTRGGAKPSTPNPHATPGGRRRKTRRTLRPFRRSTRGRRR